MIDTFSFGSIVIDGKKYTSDLVIFPDGNVADSWRRKNGHRLSGDDIRTLIASDPDVIIAGTGVNGLVIPDKALEEILSQKGIDFIYAPNQKATKYYNELITKKRVGACFHLTC